ncbi:2-hydroxyacid dehydrogenase [Planotetraspora sp. GP83]|uniref:2-hydroxyacid dehydrogenase n=1 Tax=Planotetraspora sp. GP83 TaxID=3156264 RepID=UPI0035170D55
MTGGKLLVTGAWIDTARLKSLERLGLRLRRPSHVLTEKELEHELKGAVAYLHGGEERATAAALLSAKDTLKVVAFVGVGYESFVDVAAADDLDIVVTSTPGAARDSVATFTVAQIVNTNWRIIQQLGNRYPDWDDPDELPHELSARKIGIVGMGIIGTRIAEILRQAFDANVGYYSRTRKEILEKELDLEYQPLRELVAWSDILVVMVPGNEKTKYMIDAGVLAEARKGTILINTARPSVVDPEALHTSMKEGRISLAVFDGFYPQDSEPAARLLEDFGGRLLVTGHIASHTREAMDRMVNQAVRSIENVLNGLADPYAVGGRSERLPEARESSP